VNAFTIHTGVVAPMARADIDTDQIVPKQFLKRIERSGYGRYLFHDWRYDEAGRPRPEFPLNRPEYADASILVAGRNFGCGSSREHAAWALADHGFRVVIASSFADIFRENADQNGILTVELPEAVIAGILTAAGDRAPYRLMVDLDACRIADQNGFTVDFTVEPFRRTSLMEGLDRIARTLRHEDAIAAYESQRG